VTQTIHKEPTFLAEQRAYLHELRTQGNIPASRERPHFGDLDPMICLIEDVARRSRGNVRAIDRALAALASKHAALAALLNGHEQQTPTVEVTRDETSVPPLPPGVGFPSELSRGACPWLDLYEEYSHKVSPEGYDDFHLACGLWVLSTVAARRVYVPLSKRIYTPLAIALVARTSLFAKTTTAGAAIGVLHAAGLSWLLGDDETTPQKLLADMAGYLPPNYGELDEEQRARIRQRVAMSGQRGWYYDEFGQVINAMLKANGPMADFSGLLRRLDDCRDSYAYSTRSHGQAVIEKPYLALLANMTPADLRQHADKGNGFWRDGFWARFAFLTPPAHAFKNASFTQEEVPVPTSLQERLRHWHRSLGVPAISIDAIRDEKGNDTGRYRVVRDALPEQHCTLDRDAYRAYDAYRLALRELLAASDNQDLDGSYTRLSDRALRMAALLASLENGNRIELRQWARAQEIAEMMRRNLHELYRQVNAGQEISLLEDLLIDYLKIRSGEGVTIRDIRRLGPGELRRQKSEVLRSELANLVCSGMVERTYHEGSRAEWYRLVATEPS